MSKFIVAILAVLIVIAGIYFLVFELLIGPKEPIQMSSINTFEECAAAGYPIMGSYPEQCKTPEGKTFVRKVNNPTTPTSPKPVACTLDAKICPDGSAVGRVAPSCEFAPCSTVSAPSVSASGSAKLGERVLINGVYVNPLRVVEDSRCPANVQCVWAGRLILLSKFERNGKSEEITLINGGKSASFEGRNVSLTGVSPEAHTENVPGDYVFTFLVN